MSEPQKSSDLRFHSSIEILEAAKTKVNQAPEILRDSIEPYFIARYFVAIFEARNGQIPIQVWNEYRNALDHLFRYLVDAEKDLATKSQIKSMQKHFLRAALDILKLHIHRTQDYLKEFSNKYNPRVLDLVDNGSFIKEYNRDLRNAEKLFEQAKIMDIELSDNHSDNSSVLIRYLDAAFASEKLREDIEQSIEKIAIAQSHYDGIDHKAHKHSFYEGVKIHLVASIISFLGGVLLTSMYHNYSSVFQGVKSAYAWLIDIFTANT